MDATAGDQETVRKKRCCLILLILTCVVIVNMYAFAVNHHQSFLQGDESHVARNVGINQNNNITQRLKVRAEYIRETCHSLQQRIRQDEKMMQNNPLYMEHYEPQRRLVIDPALKIAVCIQAKGGSVFWKTFFIHRTVSDGREVQFNSSVTNTRGIGFISTSSYKPQLSSLASDQYTMFTFGRNPWNRLVSLYRQKIEGRLPTDSSYKYVRGACLGKPCGTFHQLLRCVLYTWKLGLPDRHWEPLTTRCDVCRIPYTYFGRTENMNEEVAEIFRQAGIEGKIASVLDSARNFSIRDVEVKSSKVDYKEYYRNIPKFTINDLREMYMADLTLLGYPLSPL